MKDDTLQEKIKNIDTYYIDRISGKSPYTRTVPSVMSLQYRKDLETRKTRPTIIIKKR